MIILNDIDRLMIIESDLLDHQLFETFVNHIINIIYLLMIIS